MGIQIIGQLVTNASWLYFANNKIDGAGIITLALKYMYEDQLNMVFYGCGRPRVPASTASSENTSNTHQNHTKYPISFLNGREHIIFFFLIWSTLHIL